LGGKGGGTVTFLCRFRRGRGGGKRTSDPFLQWGERAERGGEEWVSSRKALSGKERRGRRVRPDRGAQLLKIKKRGVTSGEGRGGKGVLSSRCRPVYANAGGGKGKKTSRCQAIRTGRKKGGGKGVRAKREWIGGKGKKHDRPFPFPNKGGRGR